MSEFELSKISDFGDIVTGSTPPTNNSLYWNGEYNFYSPADFNDNAYCEKTDKTITKLGLSQGREIPQDSIMVTCIASIGKIAINKSIGLTNQQINTIIPFDKYDFKYIYYLLSHNTAKIKGIAAQTTIPILNKTDFGKFQLLATKDKSKQQQIAQILSTCDTVIEQTQTAIEKYKAIKQGMLHDLFTRGLTAGGQLRPTPQQAPELYKQSELGLIPKEWDIDNFETSNYLITDFTANGSFESLRNNVKYYYSKNYARLIRLTDLRVNLKNDGVYVDKEGFEFLSKSELKENDIMLANVGEYTGFACLMPKVDYPATIAPNMFLLRCNTDRFNPFYMYYFMTLDVFTRQVDNVCASSATKLLNKTNFRKLHIIKPSIYEQENVGKNLKSIDTKLQSEEALLSKYQSIKKGLMSDLLSGKRGV